MNGQSAGAWVRTMVCICAGLTGCAPAGSRRHAVVSTGTEQRRVETPHLVLEAAQGTAASSDLVVLGRARERAIARISELLGVPFTGRIRVVFYPDTITKRQATGRSGFGSADGSTITEVYSDSIRLDPFHELTHIVANQLGHPPPLFDEGLALFVTEALGANALQLIAPRDGLLDIAACSIAASGTVIPVDSLVWLPTFGLRARAGYPESGSIVKYMVSRFGMPTFLAAYHEFGTSPDSADRRSNHDRFVQIFGESESSLGAHWRQSLDCSRKRSPKIGR